MTDRQPAPPWHPQVPPGDLDFAPPPNGNSLWPPSVDSEEAGWSAKSEWRESEVLGRALPVEWLTLSVLQSGEADYNSGRCSTTTRPARSACLTSNDQSTRMPTWAAQLHHAAR